MYTLTRFEFSRSRWIARCGAPRRTTSSQQVTVFLFERISFIHPSITHVPYSRSLTHSQTSDPFLIPATLFSAWKGKGLIIVTPETKSPVFTGPLISDFFYSYILPTCIVYQGRKERDFDVCKVTVFTRVKVAFRSWCTRHFSQCRELPLTIADDLGACAVYIFVDRRYL